MPVDPNPTSARTARKVSHRWPLVSGFAALVAVVLFGALLTLRGTGTPLEIDADWMKELIEHRSPFWNVPSLLMNAIGGGLLGVILVPVGVTLTLVIFRRYWAALFFAAASILSAGAVQLLKTLFGRARPPEILVTSDYGSFPSGHVANAATIAVVIGLLFSTVAVWVAGSVYTVLMALSRTYLGAHWLTDTIGGMLLGAAVAVILWAPLAARLHAENLRPHPPVWSRATEVGR